MKQYLDAIFAAISDALRRRSQPSETVEIARIDARFLREIAELEDDGGGPLFNDAYRARLKSIAVRLTASPSQPSEPTADTLTQDDADFLAQLSDYSWDRATCVAEDAEVQKEMDLLAMIVVKVRRAASEPSEPTHCGAPNGVFTCDRDAHHEGDHHCQSGDYHHGGVTLHLSWPSEPTAEQMTEAIDHLELLSGRALIADLSGRLAAVTAEKDALLESAKAVLAATDDWAHGFNEAEAMALLATAVRRAAPTTEPGT